VQSLALRHKGGAHYIKTLYNTLLHRTITQKPFGFSSRDPPTHGHAGSRRSLQAHHRSTGVRRRAEIRGPPLHIPTLYFSFFMFSIIYRSLSFIFRM